MREITDHELLLDFARNGSEAAFTELVGRHVNLVYSAAWRFTANPEHARDITQAVFIILARKAGHLSRRTVLSGWLYQTARFTAANFVKGEIRRRQREQEAFMQSTLNDQEGTAWEEISPFLDEAMGSLAETERNAIVLRFFGNKSAREVAAALRVTEAAAHKRIQRALDKLRRLFSKRGITVSAALLAGAVSANSVQAAPVGLGATIVGAVAKGSAASASTLTLVKGVLNLMAWTKAKTVAITGVALILATGTGVVVLKEMNTGGAGAGQGLQGSWEGTLEVPQANAHLSLVFRLTREGGDYTGTLDSIDQGIGGVQLSRVEYRRPAIRLEVQSIGGVFEGTVDGASRVMSGLWKQGKLELPLELAYTDDPTPLPAPMEPPGYAARTGSRIQGLWQGTLKVGEVPLRLNFKIAESEDGILRAQLDSVDQGTHNLTASAVSFHDSILEVDVVSLDGRFKGRMTGGDRISGTWSQAGKQWPLTLNRGDALQAAFQQSYIDYEYADANDLPGHWQGTLDVKGTRLRLVFNIGKATDGALECSLVSLDQGGAELPATLVEWSRPVVRLAWRAQGATFEGTVANGKLSGTWRQGKLALPLELDRTTQL